MQMSEKKNDRHRRQDLARQVFHDIAVGGKQDTLRAVAEDGSHPIVVALDHELLSEVMQRVENAGGVANAFVEVKGGKIELIFVHLTSERAGRHNALPPNDGAENLGPEPIHRDITIGMMVTVISQYADGVICKVKLPRHTGGVEYAGRQQLQDA